MMVTIRELASRTGLSSYEIRRRVNNGTLPHMKVGSKGSKILIDFEMFIDYMRQENLKNMRVPEDIIISGYDNSDSSIGSNQLRVIN